MSRREQIAALRTREDEVSQLLVDVRERLTHLRPQIPDASPYRAQATSGDEGERRTLLRRESELMRERETLRRDLASIGIHHGLPLLAQVTIATPCPASWEDMRGEGNVRFCSQCSKHVYDLSMLTMIEAEALITRHEGKMCARVFLRTDGTVMTADCWVGRRRVGAVAVCAALVTLAVVGVGLGFDATSTQLASDGPYDVGRSADASGAMLELRGRAVTQTAMCPISTEPRTQNGQVFRTAGGMTVLRSARFSRNQ